MKYWWLQPRSYFRSPEHRPSILALVVSLFMLFGIMMVMDRDRISRLGARVEVTPISISTWKTVLGAIEGIVDVGKVEMVDFGILIEAKVETGHNRSLIARTMMGEVMQRLPILGFSAVLDDGVVIERHSYTTRNRWQVTILEATATVPAP